MCIKMVTMEASIDQGEILKQVWKIAVPVGAVVFAFVMGIAGAAFTKKQMGNDEWKAYYRYNFPFIAGLPMAVVAAFGIAAYFDVVTDGPIEVSFWGIALKGPAGPVMLWVLVFISIVSAIKILARK